ncbi:MAG: lipopolysaccharide assembly protein LapA domain-containing protein [Bacteroidales bacterium]|nr:lipopolysaccharide assembly protein LapA domain-containing protein [Bacteroidales bacterium]
MQKSLIIGLLSSLILVVFALKNNVNVQLDFIIGKPINGSLSLILLITIIIGVLVGLLISFPSIKKLKKTIHNNKAEITKLKNILDEYKKETSHKQPLPQEENTEENNDTENIDL